MVAVCNKYNLLGVCGFDRSRVTNIRSAETKPPGANGWWVGWLVVIGLIMEDDPLFQVASDSNTLYPTSTPGPL